MLARALLLAAVLGAACADIICAPAFHASVDILSTHPNISIAGRQLVWANEPERNRTAYFGQMTAAIDGQFAALYLHVVTKNNSAFSVSQFQDGNKTCTKAPATFTNYCHDTNTATKGSIGIENSLSAVFVTVAPTPTFRVYVTMSAIDSVPLDIRAGGLTTDTGKSEPQFTVINFNDMFAGIDDPTIFDLPDVCSQPADVAALPPLLQAVHRINIFQQLEA
eukprot:m.106683 g.106683  ORF g.106683 m.106683 type:complete len:222 (+) comp19006_c0_seq1:596-1261(+)